MRKPTIAVLLFCAFFSSCGEDYEWLINFDKAKFDREYAAWKALGIQNYQYVQLAQVVPDGVYMRIVVRDGKSDGIEVADAAQQTPGFVVNYDDIEQYTFGGVCDTISNVYEYLLKRYTEHSAEIKKNGEHSLTVRIMYNAQYHYPEDVDYDFSPRSGDYEGIYPLIIRIKNFTPLAASD